MSRSVPRRGLPQTAGRPGAGGRAAAVTGRSAATAAGLALKIRLLEAMRLGWRRTSSVARGDFSRKFKNARCPSAASAALRRFTKDASLSDLQSGESSLIMNFDLRCCHHFGLAHSMVSWFRCNLVEFVHCETMHTHDIIDLAWLLACIIIIAICLRVVSSVIQVQRKPELGHQVATHAACTIS